MCDANDNRNLDEAKEAAEVLVGTEAEDIARKENLEMVFEQQADAMAAHSALLVNVVMPSTTAGSGNLSRQASSSLQNAPPTGRRNSIVSGMGARKASADFREGGSVGGTTMRISSAHKSQSSTARESQLARQASGGFKGKMSAAPGPPKGLSPKKPNMARSASANVQALQKEKELMMKSAGQGFKRVSGSSSKTSSPVSSPKYKRKVSLE